METFESNPLKNLLYTLVRQAKADIEARFTAAKVGVTPLQFAVLCAAQKGRFTLNEVARTFVLRPPSLVPAVNALERVGLIRRKADATDKRKARLLVTKKGLELLGTVQLDAPGDSLNVAFRAISPAKQKQLLALLQELASSFPQALNRR